MTHRYGDLTSSSQVKRRKDEKNERKNADWMCDQHIVVKNLVVNINKRKSHQFGDNFLLENVTAK